MTDVLRVRLLRDAVRLDRSGLAVGRGLHDAAGVAAPLVVGVATGRVLEGVAVAGGALVVGFADLGSPYPVRTRIMLTASAAVALSTFVGLIGGRNDWLALLLMAVWGFGAGLAVALGQAAGFVGLLSGLALLLAEDFPTDVGEALRRAALVLGGGLLQTLLAVLVWPVRPSAPERGAIAAECRALADVAGAWPESRPSSAFIRAAGTVETMLAAHRAWAAGRSSIGETLRRLADELERIYAELFALRAEREALEGAAAGVVDAAVADVAGALRSVAHALRHPHGAAVPDERPATNANGLSESAAARLQALQARLRTLVGLVASLGRRPADDGPPRETEPRPAPPSRHSSAVAILRANLTLRSTAFRHGLRLGAALTIAVVIYRLLPLGRGYWVPLTVIFVLKPDFGSTFMRGLQRYAGTAVGVGLATLVAAALNPGDWVNTALVALFAWAAYAFFFANYALFTVSITSLIVFFVAFQGVNTYTAILDRLEDTAIGGALALAAFALWPTWEGSRDVAANVSDMLDADRRFLAAVLAGALTPGAADAEAVRRARSAARLARTNAEASLERALSEPERKRGDVSAAAGVLFASRSLADAVLATDAHRLDGSGRQVVPGLAPLAAQLDGAVAELVRAQRDQRAPDALPPLRRTYDALPPTTPEWILRETAEMLDSIEAITRLLGGVESTDAPSRDAARLA